MNKKIKKNILDDNDGKKNYNHAKKKKEIDTDNIEKQYLIIEKQFFTFVFRNRIE